MKDFKLVTRKGKKSFNASPLLQTPLFKCLKLDFVEKRYWQTHNLTYFPL